MTGDRTFTADPELLTLLKSFPADQFLFPKNWDGVFADPGYLDLFSGERGVAKSWVHHTGDGPYVLALRIALLKILATRKCKERF